MAAVDGVESSGDAAAPHVPRATYRVQFTPQFGFADATALVPYLQALGISHFYASPYLKARSGSTHGYDITDHNAFNPEIGDARSFAALADTLAEHGLGHILDFVPNHMGVGHADNAWWLDVLEWGPASPYADHFDIDWQPAQAELRGKVLLPFLGDHYGRVLERGELELRFDADAGSLDVWYYDHRFPLRAVSYVLVLKIARPAEIGEAAWSRLQSVTAGLRALRTAGESRRRQLEARERGAALKRALAELARQEPGIARALDQAVAHFNGAAGEPHSFRPLHRLLEMQHYRLAYWRVAADEINYRRFFEINELAGIRVERPAVFEAMHGLVLDLIASNRVQGLRIDHIDGLYDPAEYCRRLRRHVAGTRGNVPFYLVVEKILANHEWLRSDWPVEGTTGYEALNEISGLFVDPAGEVRLTRCYRQFTGETASFDEVLYAAKKHIMSKALAGEIQVLANRLTRIARSNWRTRDFTLNGVRAALAEVVAHFPVYRTYVADGVVDADDRRDIEWAVARARRGEPAVEGTLFDFIAGALTGDLARGRRSGYNRRDVARFAMRFQQYTGPVMAKSLEDTAFYRFHRLVSLNEVGGDPRRFGVSVAAFHHLAQQRLRHWPHSMVATATHDTKRGEDARARLNVLSEIAGEWDRRVRRWRQLNASRKSIVNEASAPSANDEYLLYQTLIASWPMELVGAAPSEGDALAAYRSRIERYMVKAAREAKVLSSWAAPNSSYEDALIAFVRHLLDADRPNPFLADLGAFASDVARFGMINGLAQLVLKLTVPGVPDIYQGCELWDLSLVDPDNRRPVDFAARRDALETLRRACPGGHAAAPDLLVELLDGWPDGRVKLYVAWKLLALRAAWPGVFAAGSYQPAATAGARADNVVAFARAEGDRSVLVVVPRLLAGRGRGGGEAPGSGADAWRDTVVAPDAAARPGPWRNLFTGEEVTPEVAEGFAPHFSAARLLATFPVAVFMRHLEGESTAA